MDFSGIKVNKKFTFANILKKKQKFSHSYHRYPAKFIPQIVGLCLNL